ncbi:peroxidase-like protein [Ylistrum balloti]|uniref:peroxidase-like protein n=1 Tax=Ylistrum balloti TaxID=509963 RepID=UPI002905D994|nr:peroxidase-like protein [Ylistrum balloti]
MMAAGVLRVSLTLAGLFSCCLSSHVPTSVDLVSNLIKICVDTAIEQVNSERMGKPGGHSAGHKQHHGHHSQTMNSPDNNAHNGHSKGHMDHTEGGHSHEHVRILDRNARIIRQVQENFKKLTGAWPEAIMKDEMLMKEWRKHVTPHCEFMAQSITCESSSRYRTADGTCNNVDHPFWASTMMPQTRFLPPQYEDEINAPRTKSINGRQLPSTRLISNVVHSNTGQSSVYSKKSTNMFMAYGQFLDHDILHTPVLKDDKGKDMKCCPLGNKDDHCFPIPVPLDDPMFRGWCMSFVRSSATPFLNCDPGHREQLNHPTSYIDGSTIYGSNKVHQDELRLHHNGRIKLTPSGHLHSAPEDECILSSPGHHCFQSGDGRRHVTPTLTCLHLLFVKEHNKVADGLRALNPNWDDEHLFQEAKRIVAAELQHITFSEYLPIVLGKEQMERYGLFPTAHGYNNVYDSTVDASTSNAFGAAAFRFGHSEVPGVLAMMARNYSLIKAIPLHTQFNRPDLMFDEDGDENMMRWMANSYHDRNDRRLQDSVRNFLFLKDDGESFDLAAINIQRGRDHGLAPYNTWRKWCGLQTAIHFGDGFGRLVDHDQATRKLLSTVYTHPDDIDLYTGGLSEIRLPGAAVGPTFACIIARQFKKYQSGDRHWYETDHVDTRFTLPQLNEIKKTSLASVLCKNTGTQLTQPSVFLATDDYSNRKLLCNQIPSIDLSLWQEHSEAKIPLFQSPLRPSSFLNPLQSPNTRVFKDVFNKLLQNLRRRMLVKV